MPERDASVDPRPGDLLRGKKSTRYIGRVFPNGDIGYTYWRIGFEYGAGNDCFTSPEAWRKWARNAEVIERGKDA